MFMRCYFFYLQYYSLSQFETLGPRKTTELVNNQLGLYGDRSRVDVETVLYTLLYSLHVYRVSIDSQLIICKVKSGETGPQGGGAFGGEAD